MTVWDFISAHICESWIAMLVILFTIEGMWKYWCRAKYRSKDD